MELSRFISSGKTSNGKVYMWIYAMRMRHGGAHVLERLLI